MEGLQIVVGSDKVGSQQNKIAKISDFKPRDWINDLLLNKNVLTALNGREKQILEASNKPMFMDMDDFFLIDNLCKVVSVSKSIIGLRDDPVASEMEGIRTVLVDAFGSMTLGDLKNAMQMCVTGELDEYLPKNAQKEPDREHYQIFSAAYVSKCLNAYQKRKNRAMQKAQLASEQSKEQPKYDFQKKEGSLYNFWINEAICCFQFYCKNPSCMPWDEVFFLNIQDPLYDSGLLMVKLDCGFEKNAKNSKLVESNIKDLFKEYLKKQDEFIKKLKNILK